MCFEEKQRGIPRSLRPSDTAGWHTPPRRAPRGEGRAARAPQTAHDAAARKPTRGHGGVTREPKNQPNRVRPGPGSGPPRCPWVFG